MRTSDNMKGTLADIASLVKDEFKTISTSYAILLVLVGGIFLYGLLYNYMYAPDLVRNAPVVVVDDSKTDLSREYIRLLNATPQVSVIADGLDYAEAQEWMKEGDAVGILYLPSDFETGWHEGMNPCLSCTRRQAPSYIIWRCRRRPAVPCWR